MTNILSEERPRVKPINLIRNTAVSPIMSIGDLLSKAEKSLETLFKISRKEEQDFDNPEILSEIKTGEQEIEELKKNLERFGEAMEQAQAEGGDMPEATLQLSSKAVQFVDDLVTLEEDTTNIAVRNAQKKDVVESLRALDVHIGTIIELFEMATGEIYSISDEQEKRIEENVSKLKRRRAVVQEAISNLQG